ncbi:MAG: hypothetical protein JNM66_17455 [Bryobacterales bacterium]|nr:hypothetical protein [Bryobacterales bacterium]
MAKERGQRISPGAKKRGEPGGISETVRGDCLPDSDTNCLAAASEHLSGQKHGSERWVDQPGELKPSAVAPLKKDGQDARASLDCQTRRHGLPLGVQYAPQRETNGGNLPGREDNECATGRQMTEGGTNSGTVGVRSSPKWIDGDNSRGEFR